MKSKQQRRATTRPETGSVGFRQSALAIACVLAAGGAFAQSANYKLTLPTTRAFTSSYTDKYIQNNQATTANVTATILNNYTGSALTTTSVAGAPVSTTNNSSMAMAIGNIVDPNMIDLFLIQPVSGSAGILSSQVRANPAATPISTIAQQTGVTQGVQETAHPAAVVTVTGNSIGSSTTLNTERSVIAGTLPGNYANGTDGSVVSSFNAAATPQINTTATAGVGINSNQVSYNAASLAGSQATVAGSSVLLDLQNSSSGLSSALTLSQNSVNASFIGNGASNSVAVNNATSALAGSVAVNNSQANIEDTGAAVPTAVIGTSQILADVTSRTATPTTLSAPLTLDSNTVSATSSGNTAGSRGTSGIVAGNSITVAPGIDITGAGSTTGNTLVNGNNLLTTSAAADLVLANGQGNQGTNLSSTVTGSSAALRGGVVSMRADTLAAGGSLTASSNTVNAGSTGNLAGNLISTSSSNFTASAAAANSQSNDATGISSNVTNGTVAVNVGTTGGTITGNLTSTRNTVSASADGSVGATSVDIGGTNLTATGSAAPGATATSTGYGATSASAGVSATNLQANYGAATTIGATVSNSFVAVNVADQSGGGTPLVGLSGSNVTLDGNAITSAAAGNTGTTGVSMHGSNVTGSGAVGNDQFNGNIVTGLTQNSGVTMNSGTTATSNLTITGNTVSSAGTANTATNSVNVAGSTVLSSAIAASAGTTSAAGVATANAAYAIASGQRNEAAVSSSTTNTLAAGAGGSFATVYAGTAATGITGGIISVAGNDVTSDTRGNRVTNGITVSASNFDTPANAATAIAGIANTQTNVVTGVANATVNSLAPSVTGVGLAYTGGLTGVTAGVTGNTVAATSLGNQAGNTLGGTGPNLSSLPPAGATGLADAAAGTVTNEFAIANTQSDTVSGGRTASVTNVTLGISNATAAITVGTSNLTVSGNQLTAEARNNDATNAVGLTGFASLSSGAGVANQQSSSTNVGADVTNGRVRIRTTGNSTINDSTLVMNDNTVQALAVGSSASNGVTASAGTLSGNANNATSGVTYAAGTGALTGANVPAINADYGVANAQVQTGSVSASTSTPIRIVTGNIGGGSGGSATSGGSFTLTGNASTAIAQATSASNSLTLASTGDASALTGAVGSGQFSSGAVTSLVRPEVGGAAVTSIDAGSFGGTAVAVTGNSLTSSAGQNEAFNTQKVSGANITGNGGGGATGIDFVTANDQGATGAVSASVIPGVYGVLVDNVGGGNVAVTGNTINATASVNNSANALLMGKVSASTPASSSVSATGLVQNTQSATTGAVSASVGSTVDVANDSIGVVPGNPAATVVNFSGTNLSVANNTSTSQASRNTTDNTLRVDSVAITGGTGNPGSFAIGSTQTAAANTTATTDLNVVGAVAGTVGGTPVNVSANQIVTTANDNTARNGLALVGVSTVASSANITNAQTAGLAADTTSATTNVTNLGLAPGSTGDSSILGSSVTVTGNGVMAQAGRNAATNTLVASATTVTGTAAGTDSSFMLNNTQAAVGAVGATSTVGSIGATATNGSGSALTVTSNRVDALANANSATSSMTLAGTSATSGTSALNNTQTSGTAGAVTATVTTTAVGVLGGATGATLGGAPVTVTGNVLNADASRNTATNTVTVSGVSVTGGTPVAPSSASFNITSSQTGDFNVTSTNNLGLVGVRTDNAGGTTFGVVDNEFLASANVNIATNKLSLGAISSLAGSGAPIGALSNTQNSGTLNATAVSATVGGASDVARATVGVSPSTTNAVLNGSATSVTGNVMSAQGGGNTATNTLEATAINSIGGSTFPTFGVLNAQTNAATVTTTVGYANIGLTSGAAGSTSGSAVTVQGNQVMAKSYGNSAYNAVSLTALTGLQNQASAQVNNTQTNSAAITSTAQGVMIGMSGGALVGGSSVVNNNAVSALSVGNSAANYIVAK